MSDSGKRYKTLWGSETTESKVVGFCRLHGSTLRRGKWKPNNAPGRAVGHLKSGTVCTGRKKNGGKNCAG